MNLFKPVISSCLFVIATTISCRATNITLEIDQNTASRLKKVDIIVVTITMLPAGCGDALLISCGDDISTSHILIDSGVKETEPVLREALHKTANNKLDLIIITHIDADHIDGMLALLEANTMISWSDFWMNGYVHLSPNPPSEGALEAASADQLSKIISEKKDSRWNYAFQGKSVVVSNELDFPERWIGEHIKLTIMAPYWPNLEKLKSTWRRALEKLEESRRLKSNAYSSSALNLESDRTKLALTESPSDASVPNSTSIAVLLEYQSLAFLFPGDLPPSILTKSIKMLLKKRGLKLLNLTALKISHHGSKSNTSLKLLADLNCKTFLVSTDGSKHMHPHAETISRIVCRNKREEKKIVFNYKNNATEIWDNEVWKQDNNYTTVYGNGNGVTLNFSSPTESK